MPLHEQVLVRSVRLQPSAHSLRPVYGNRLWAQGNEVDVHAAHFHGHSFSEGGRNLDSFRLIPSVVRTTTLVPDNPGVWLYHCHVRLPTALQ